MSDRKPTDLIARIKAANPQGRTLAELAAANPGNPFADYKPNTLIDDAQWLELQKLSGLADTDRRHLENDLRAYRNERDDEIGSASYTPSETRDQLTRLADRTFDLHADIERVLDNDRAAWALVTPSDTGWDAQRIWTLSNQLEHFALLAFEAADRCGRVQPGPRSDDLRGLIRSLAETWTAATGELVSPRKALLGPNRTWNFLQFVIAAMKIADPNGPGPEKIVNLIKNMQRGREFG